LESPAQRALQRRLGADNMEDIVASLALIRPGPIKGNMVDPFLARRRGEEAVTYPRPELKPVLEKTYGVVLFQEQVIEIARLVAGFSAGEADQLRRVMTQARSEKEMAALGEKFVARAVEQGLAAQEAERHFFHHRRLCQLWFLRSPCRRLCRHSLQNSLFVSPLSRPNIWRRC
jgi:error-prone DNA polymerase